MHQRTLAELSDGLARGEFSSVELTRAFLNRIESFNDSLNCFITVCSERAMEQAQQSDRARARGSLGRLAGIPYAVKDVLCTEGIRTTCASRMLENFIAPYDATVVKKLGDAGMVMIGKTNMDEFAMGSSNETSYFGPARNPWDTDRVPGGSSGGSACAVAAQLAPAAIGTDTGGSVRQPAAFCGVTGLKPTYGRVSRFGLVAFASSLDQAGPIAHSALDCAMLLGAMAGFDHNDSTSAIRPVEDFLAAIADPLDGIRIGIPTLFDDGELPTEMLNAIAMAKEVFRSLGAAFCDIDLPNVGLSVPTYYIIASAECSSNLSRYDGVRFGYRCPNPEDMNDLYCRSRGDGFGAEVKRRIMIGTYVLSAGYYDAYYLKAQKVRRLVRQDFQRAFDEVDLIMGLVTPTIPFRLGEKLGDPVSMYKSDIYTVPASLAGLPAMSIPTGFVEGLPVGVQLIGNYFEEARILNAAHLFQCETNWHRQAPPEFSP
jgi:aspartyl-tRNA(Asn)/glutamyl-tRNA(Gln) amidotransferase subunit A